MAGRSRSHRHAHTTTQPPASQSGADLSLLQKPMELSITGALQVARCLSSGTPEMRELLTEECDIIFECRVCRNLFRNLPNFIAHKRHYCMQCYSDTKLNFVETKPEHETLLIQPEAPKQRHVKAKEQTASEKQAKHVSNTEKTVVEKTESVPVTPKVNEPLREIVTEGKSQTFQFYTKAAERVEVSASSMKRCLVELEDLQGNRNAKRQKVVLQAGEKEIRAAAKKSSPSMADLSIITQSFERSESSPENNVEVGGPRRISLRQRGGGGEVQNPIAEKLSKRKDCDVKTHTCLKCKSTYSSLKTLHFHMMSLHSEKRTFYPCVYSKCDATFTQIWVAVRHLQKSHGCSKKQIDKMRDHLKKFAYTRAVDEIGEYENPRRATPIDLSLLRSSKRKLAEERKEKVDKVKREATETITHVTKRLSEKLKKPRDTKINFGSGFTLYKCQNCSKAFAKEDSLNRHKAFCFGLGALGIETINPSAYTKDAKKAARLCMKTDKEEHTKQGRSSTEAKATKKSVIKEESTAVEGQVNTQVKPLSTVSSESEERRTSEESQFTNITTQETVPSGSVPDSTTSHGNNDDRDRSNGSLETPRVSPAATERKHVSERTFHQFTPMEDSATSEEDKNLQQTTRWYTDLNEKELEKIESLINEDELQCLKCNRKYGNISNLHRHAFRHLGWKRFRCTLCEFTGYNRSECKTHLTRVHLEKSDTDPNKFILDLEPEKMKVGVSVRSRVERKRQSSLRVLQKMQEVRRERQSNALSPTKRGLEQFNISTRNSPRAFDIRPYQRMDQEAVLFTRSGHYPKPPPAAKEDENEDEEEEEGKESEVEEETAAEAHPANPPGDAVNGGQGEEDEEGQGQGQEGRGQEGQGQEGLRQGQEGEATTAAVLLPPPVDDALVEPTIEETSANIGKEITIITEPQQGLQENGEMQADEVIYLVVDGEAGHDIEVAPTDATLMQTVTVDAEGHTQLQLDSGQHSILVLNEGMPEVIASPGPEIIASPSEPGLVEEVVEEGTEEVITSEIITEEVAEETVTESPEEVVLDVGTEYLDHPSVE